MYLGACTGACFVGYSRGASGAIPGAHCKIHDLLGNYSSKLRIHHLQGRSSKGRSSGALGIRVKTGHGSKNPN